jgi:hypothetical protein
VTPKPISLITLLGLPSVPSPTICGVSEGRGGFLQSAPRMPEGIALRDRLRTALAVSPISTDRIEFTVFIFIDKRRYGPAVLVPLLSTPCFHDAVTVRYRTILHRTEADSHRSDPAPFQAHERRIYSAEGRYWPPDARNLFFGYGKTLQISINQSNQRRHALESLPHKCGVPLCPRPGGRTRYTVGKCV